jgi:predicted alpha/beta superfamily hydrolase
MHDGQMLFDSTITPNKQEWQVDETITKLSSEDKIRDCIVVGIFNNKKYRGAEFIPMVVLNGLVEPYRSRYIKTQMQGKPLSDNYLKFMVLELKPYIDKSFSTKTDPANTITIGSSGGALISVYAFCKYPEIFGGAACLSTFWPMDHPWFQINKREIPDSLFATLNRFILNSLLNSPKRKIYFDNGSEKNFEHYQILVDSVMKKAGYNSENWLTRRFPADNHSEKSWSRRLHFPLEFLLAK